MAGRTLQVFIAADTKKFRDGLDDAERRMRGFDGSIGGLAGSMKNVLGPAMLAAGAAAGALAAKFAVDGIQAAADQEQANLKLEKSFAAVGASQDLQKAQDYLRALQDTAGVSEDETYPALALLVGKTGEFKDAQILMNAALETAKAKGEPLEPIVKALAKAYGGNYDSLLKLVPELDKTAIKSGDVYDATNALQKLFGGTAAEQAETFKGKIDRMKLGMGELQEAFGTGFLEAVQGGMDKLNGEDSFGQTMRDMEPTFKSMGEWLGTLLSDLAVIADNTKTVMDAFNNWKDSIPGLGTVLNALTTGPIRILSDALRELNRLMGQSPIAEGAPERTPNVPSRGGVGYQPTTLGPAPVSSTRTPTVVAPVSGLAKATASQALRTSGKVRLLG
jgi:hypothetical protein